ncbi:MAG: phosphotransferase family protein [Gammaproteobacteria bacterium]|nr:phosphotransferase family protein [Gammaproteobacteria bacterium]|tara:strand:+ start:1301 stop:2344 length:1044 start_codon:yes stop_codon:yes gene_type:complete
MSDVELTQVREAHKFDEAALTRYMQAHVEDFNGPLTIKQFEGGQSNPTFQLITPSRTYVMRKQPPGELLPSAHQVDREYKVMAALWATPVPVPKMYCLCEDVSIIGTKFYIMEMVEGRLFTETRLPSCSKSERSAIYLDLARVLAELHNVDPLTVGLGEFGRPGNYYERQIGRWSKQYIASKTEDIAAMDQLMEWLPQNIPADAGSVIVHGDYRLGNVLIHPSEPKIVAVLDWELSTLGDGLADLGYICQDYHGDAYDDEGLAGADHAALGIPTEAEFVAEYCKHASREGIDNWPFYLIYNMFRSAGIIQGVYKRGLDGNASSEKALEYADAARLRSERGWAMVKDI